MNNAILDTAFKIIFGKEPVGDIEDWQLAEAILNEFNIPKLGEELAKQCIFRIVNHVFYPDRDTTARIVGHAENLATELWDELPDEPHMADIAVLEYITYSPRC